MANAGPDQTVFVSTTGTLDGSGSSDADSNPLTYKWSLTAPAGSSAQLSSATAVKSTFVVDKSGTYTAQLIVNDGTVDSVPDQVVITAQLDGPPALTESSLSEVRAAWARFRTEQGQEWGTGWDSVTGTPTRLSGGKSQPFAGDSETAARQFLSAYRDLFQMKAGLADLTVRFLSSSSADEGLTQDSHVRFAQSFQNLRVFNGGIEVHLTGDGRVYLVFNYYAPEAVLAQVSRTPGLTAQQIVQLAEADYPTRTLYDLGGQPFTPDPASALTTPELGLFRVDDGYHLVYRVQVGMILYILEANSGIVLDAVTFGAS